MTDMEQRRGRWWPVWLVAPVMGAGAVWLAIPADRGVPDVILPPLPTASSGVSLPPDLDDSTVARVVPRDPELVVPVEVVTPSVREPQRFDTPPVYGEVDYREGRIMEPWPRDSLENQRVRAYARCVAGLEDDVDQVAYCDRNYGPIRATTVEE